MKGEHKKRLSIFTATLLYEIRVGLLHALAIKNGHASGNFSCTISQSKAQKAIRKIFFTEAFHPQLLQSIDSVELDKFGARFFEWNARLFDCRKGRTQGETIFNNHNVAKEPKQSVTRFSTKHQNRQMQGWHLQRPVISYFPIINVLTKKTKAGVRYKWKIKISLINEPSVIHH